MYSSVRWLGACRVVGQGGSRVLMPSILPCACGLRFCLLSLVVDRGGGLVRWSALFDCVAYQPPGGLVGLLGVLLIEPGKF